jgi:hypothetical protein
MGIIIIIAPSTSDVTVVFATFLVLCFAAL